MSHPDANDLAGLFDAVGRWRPTFLHFLDCPCCAEVARAVFAFHDELAAEPKPVADYGPAFRRTRAVASVLVQALDVQAAESEELLAEVLALEPQARAAALVTAERFRSYGLAERLLAQARTCAGDRSSFASLAVLILESWPNPRQEVRDLRAEARAELADALRYSGHYETAERELANAAADLRESTDPQCRAGFCQTLARLRYEQGRFDEAWALIDRAADLHEDADDRPAQAAACIVAGQWALGQGEPERATARFDAALTVAGLADEQRRLALRGLARSLKMDGRGNEARRLLEVILERERRPVEDKP